MTLVIPRALLARMRQIAEDAYPRECCGLLIGAGERGRSLTVDELAPAPNVAAEAHRHFEVDPTVHLRVQRELRGSGRRVIGHYHSHPDGRAVPSETDRASVEDRELVWAILSVAPGEGTTTRAWMPGEGASFEELDLVVR